MKTFATIATILLLASPAIAQECTSSEDDLTPQIAAAQAAAPYAKITVYRGAEAQLFLAYFDSIEPRPAEAADADTVVVVTDPDPKATDEDDTVALVKGNCIEVVGHPNHDVEKRVLGNPA